MFVMLMVTSDVLKGAELMEVIVIAVVGFLTQLQTCSHDSDNGAVVTVLVTVICCDQL